VKTKSGSGQDTPDSGSEVHALLKGFACIAVEIGQHSGKTAQTGRDQAHRHVKAEMIGDAPHRNAGSGTASDVLLKIAQIENATIRKNTAKDTKIPPFRKEQFAPAFDEGNPVQCPIRDGFQVACVRFACVRFACTILAITASYSSPWGTKWKRRVVSPSGSIRMARWFAGKTCGNLSAHSIKVSPVPSK
jgi:hypothetical protein